MLEIRGFLVRAAGRPIEFMEEEVSIGGDWLLSSGNRTEATAAGRKLRFARNGHEVESAPQPASLQVVWEEMTQIQDENEQN